MQCWTLTALSGLCVLSRLSRCSLLLLVIITKHLLKLALEFLEKRHDVLSFACRRETRSEGAKKRSQTSKLIKLGDSQENTET